jgi:GAF domain-containing protein
LIAELDRDVLEDIVVGDPEYLDLLRGMGSSSYMCVPLRLGGHTLGAMGLISARSAATEPKT